METPATNRPDPSSGLAHRIANWLLRGESSVSSKFMAGVALNGAGYRSKWQQTAPHDAAEFGRCVQLLQAVPEVRDCFHVLRDVNAVWRLYVDRWEDLTALWRVGDMNRTNERLKELRRGGSAERETRSAEPEKNPTRGASEVGLPKQSQPGELTPHLL